MNKHEWPLIRKAGMSTLRLTLLGALLTVPICAAAADTDDDRSADPHAAHRTAAPARLVQAVREATQRYTDVNLATSAGYGPFLGCVSGPDAGAMGIHYVNGNLVGDGEIDVSRPEALIYEPTQNGLRLVGVEFIVDAAAWRMRHTTPPVLEGQVFHLVDSPNRFGLPAFFELHVWAWRQNPKGAFVDWNTRVSCEQQ